MAEEFNRKIFNKGARNIDYGRPSGKVDKAGREIITLFTLKPQTASSFTEAEANKLLRLFKNELIDMNNVTVESLTDAGVGTQAAEQSRQDANEIARRLADAREMRKQNAYESAIKEGFSVEESREIAGLPMLTDEERAALKSVSSANVDGSGKRAVPAADDED